jgi:hypothetical protein
VNPFEFVIAIIAIVTVGNIIRTRQMTRHGMRPDHPFGMMGRWRRGDDRMIETDDRETRQLRDEVKELKDRIKVLERIAVDKENSLAQEIDSLRDR